MDKPKGEGARAGEKAERPAKPVKLPAQQVAAKLTPRLAAEMDALLKAGAAPGPEGAQAAPGGLGSNLRLALPNLLTGLIQLGAIAADGQVSAEELKSLAGKLVEFVKGARSGGG